MAAHATAGGIASRAQQVYQQLDHLHHRALGRGDNARWRMIDDREEAFDLVFGGGGFGAVPASAAAAAALEKQTFHAGGGGGGTECAICRANFEDGEELTVMPCFHGHEFHSDCITEWLRRSNMCALSAAINCPQPWMISDEDSACKFKTSST